jgi:hypothetical protein
MKAILSRIPPPANDVANNGPGGGAKETFCGAITVAVRLRRCSDSIVLRSCASPTTTAVVGCPHRSLVIVPLSQTIPVIVIVLLLPPERMLIPDRDSHLRRATYDDDGGLASIHARGLSSLSAWLQGRPALIPPFPLSAPRQHRLRNLRHVRRPLEVACVCTSVLPSFYEPLRFFPVGIAMINQPCRRRSDSPHPWPIPIPTRGTPRPLRGQILPHPFRGGPQTRP